MGVVKQGHSVSTRRSTIVPRQFQGVEIERVSLIARLARLLSPSVNCTTDIGKKEKNELSVPARTENELEILHANQVASWPIAGTIIRASPWLKSHRVTFFDTSFLIAPAEAISWSGTSSAEPPCWKSGEMTMARFMHTYVSSFELRLDIVHSSISNCNANNVVLLYSVLRERI